MTPPAPYFTDAEVDDMCAGLSQNTAKIRFLRSLGLRVDRKPNGRPLAWRPQATPTDGAHNAPQEDAGVVGRMQAWASSRAARKAPHGQKA